jgi:hypothetical protein
MQNASRVRAQLRAEQAINSDNLAGIATDQNGGIHGKSARRQHQNRPSIPEKFISSAGLLEWERTV